MKRTIIAAGAALGLFLIGSAWASEVREVEWMDLMPESEKMAWDEASQNVDHSGYASAEEFQSWETVGEFDGARIRIPGFVVPVETDGEGNLRTFFLVPYFGACIHVPPPPANQIIYGRLEKPVPMVNIWDAFYMEGTLNIEEISNETADSAYTMAVDSLKPYSG